MKRVIQPPVAKNLNLKSRNSKPSGEKANGVETTRNLLGGKTTPSNGCMRIAPNPEDILLGCGQPFQSHPGNEAMRRLADEHKDRYHSLQRERRGLVANELLRKILDSGSRFLKLCPGEAPSSRSLSRRKKRTSCVTRQPCWEEATKEEAYEKLCHALRAKDNRGHCNAKVDFNLRKPRPPVDTKKDRSDVVTEVTLQKEAASFGGGGGGDEDRGNDDSTTSIVFSKDAKREEIRGSNGSEAITLADVTSVAIRMAIEAYLENKK